MTTASATTGASASAIAPIPREFFSGDDHDIESMVYLWGSTTGPNPARFVVTTSESESAADQHIGDELTLDMVIAHELRSFPDGKAFRKHHLSLTWDVTIRRDGRAVAIIRGNLDGPGIVERFDG